MNHVVGITRQAAELRLQARKMASEAWSVLQIADALSPQGGARSPRNNAREPVSYEHDCLFADLANQLLRQRSQRYRYFPARIFDSQGWDMVLILYRNRVEGRRAVLINLFIEL